MRLERDENLVRDGLKFKRDLGSPDSSLSCYRNGLFILREQIIQKAKNAMSKNKEDRAAFFMGMVEGIDQAVAYPEAMIRKWESLVQDEVLARSNGDGA